MSTGCPNFYDSGVYLIGLDMRGYVPYSERHSDYRCVSGLLSLTDSMNCMHYDRSSDRQLCDAHTVTYAAACFISYALNLRGLI